MKSDNTIIINEININPAPLLKSLFTGIKNLFKNSSDDVAKYASAEISKVIQRTAKSGVKNISLNVLRSSAEYKKSLTALGEDYALKTFKKSFKNLTSAEKTTVIKETSKNLDSVLKKELQITAGEIGSNIADNVLKGVKLTRAGSKTAQITKTINALNKTTKATAQRIIRSNSVLIGDGSKGFNIVSKIKSGEIVIIKNGKHYITQTKNLSNQPVKLFKITKKGLLELAKWGVVISAAAYLLAQAYPNQAVAVVDENGNDLNKSNDAIDNSDWGACLNSIISSNQGNIKVLPDGTSSVFVSGTEKYPNGLTFYSNNRVFNHQNKTMGTWSCKDSSAPLSEMSLIKLINEQISDEQMDSDVNNMIDLLDFPVTGSNLQDAVRLLKKYVVSPRGKDFLELYRDSGFSVSDLRRSIDNVRVSEPASVRAKKEIYSLISQIESGKTINPKIPTLQNKTSNVTINEDSVIDIVWDKSKTSSTDGTKPPKPKKSIYHDCSNKDFPFEFGCINPKIGEIQSCLGVEPTKGYFGPKTKNALRFYNLSGGITQELYNKVMEDCNLRQSSLKKSNIERPSPEKVPTSADTSKLDLTPRTYKAPE